MEGLWVGWAVFVESMRRETPGFRREAAAEPQRPVKSKRCEGPSSPQGLRVGEMADNGWIDNEH